MDGGIPASVADLTLTLPLQRPRLGRGAVCRVTPARSPASSSSRSVRLHPSEGFLQRLHELVAADGALLVLDEMVTGFRWDVGGAQQVARRHARSVDVRQGDRQRVRVCQRSPGGARSWSSAGCTTIASVFPPLHDARRGDVGLAAGIATMATYEDEPVIETLHGRGEPFRDGVEAAARAAGHRGAFHRCWEGFVPRSSARRTPSGRPSQAFRTLFLQETITRGVLAPSFVVSYSHSERTSPGDRGRERGARSLRDRTRRWRRAFPPWPAGTACLPQLQLTSAAGRSESSVSTTISASASTWSAGG